MLFDREREGGREKKEGIKIEYCSIKLTQIMRTKVGFAVYFANPLFTVNKEVNDNC